MKSGAGQRRGGGDGHLGDRAARAGGVLRYRNVQRFRGGLVFKAHRLLYRSKAVCCRRGPATWWWRWAFWASRSSSWRRTWSSSSAPTARQRSRRFPNPVSSLTPVCTRKEGYNTCKHSICRCRAEAWYKADVAVDAMGWDLVLEACLVFEG